MTSDHFLVSGKLWPRRQAVGGKFVSAERRMTSDHFLSDWKFWPSREAVGGKFAGAERRMTSDHFSREKESPARPACRGGELAERRAPNDE